MFCVKRYSFVCLTGMNTHVVHSSDLWMKAVKATHSHPLSLSTPWCLWGSSVQEELWVSLLHISLDWHFHRFSFLSFKARRAREKVQQLFDRGSSPRHAASPLWLVRSCATVQLYKTLQFEGVGRVSCRDRISLSGGKTEPSEGRTRRHRFLQTCLAKWFRDAELRQVLGDLLGQVGESRRTVQASEWQEPRGLETSGQDPKQRGIPTDNSPGCEDVCSRLLQTDRENITQTWWFCWEAHWSRWEGEERNAGCFGTRGKISYPSST